MVLSRPDRTKNIHCSGLTLIGYVLGYLLDIVNPIDNDVDIIFLLKHFRVRVGNIAP